LCRRLLRSALSAAAGLALYSCCFRSFDSSFHCEIVLSLQT